MSAKYYCNNTECKEAFYYEVPDEIMIDEINMAAFYCPICPDRLVRSGPPRAISKYSIAADKVPNNNYKRQ